MSLLVPYKSGKAPLDKKSSQYPAVSNVQSNKSVVSVKSKSSQPKAVSSVQPSQDVGAVGNQNESRKRKTVIAIVVIGVVVLIVVVIAVAVAVSSFPESQREILQVHNYYRRKHGAADLVLSTSLNSFAQEWADHLASTGKWEHRVQDKYGENLYYQSSSGGKDNATISVISWYNEINEPQCRTVRDSDINFLDCGHLTQLLWKSSTDLGVGIATGASRLYVVCNYYPPGNVRGQYDANVQLSSANMRRISYYIFVGVWIILFDILN